MHDNIDDAMNYIIANSKEMIGKCDVLKHVIYEKNILVEDRYNIILKSLISISNCNNDINETYSCFNVYPSEIKNKEVKKILNKIQKLNRKKFYYVCIINGIMEFCRDDGTTGRQDAKMFINRLIKLMNKYIELAEKTMALNSYYKGE